MERIVVAHQGGFDTLIAIPWLAATRQAEVVAVTLDLGQGLPLEDIHERALAMGAARAHVVDARESFARDFVLPAMRVNAAGGAPVPELQPLVHAAVAKALLEIARIEGARAVAFGGADGALAALVRALDPSLEQIRVPDAGTPHWDDAVALAQGRRVPLPPVSKDAPAEPEAPGSLAARLPVDAAHVELGFDKGVPVSVNGVDMPLVEIMPSLETIAGTHGVNHLVLLQMAFASLHRPALRRGAAFTGTARFRLRKGECRSTDRRAARTPRRSALKLVESAAR
jgi:argininosuccinate synthase